MAVNHLAQPTIELGRADAGIPNFILLLHGGHQLLDTLAGLRRQHDDRHTAQARQRAQQRIIHGLAYFLAVEFQIPFIDGNHQPAPLALHQIGQLNILLVKRAGRIDEQHDNLGEFHRAQAIGDRQFFELFRNAGFFAHACRIPQRDGARATRRVRALPCPIDRNTVAGNARLRPGQQALLAQQIIDEGRFTGIGTAQNGDPQGLVRVILKWLLRVEIGVFLVFFHRIIGRFIGRAMRRHGVAYLRVKLVRAVAVLGRQRNRITQPQTIGLIQACFRRPALAFIGGQQHRHIGLAQQPRKQLIFRQDADTRIGQHQHHIGFFNGGLGLRAHTRLQ